MTQVIIFLAEDLIFGVIVGAVGLVWFRKDLRLKIMYTALIALPLGYSLAKIAGMFYGHHQPFVEQGFTPLIPHAIDNAFPSDHVLVGGIFASLACLADRRFGLELWVLVLLVGLSRELAGLHYAVDILAAAVLALGAVFVARRAVLWVGGGQLYP